MRQPTHDHLARPDHLLPVNADVLAQARPFDRLRPPSDHQTPSDQRCDITRPTGLDRPACQVDLVAHELHLTARPIAPPHWLHVPHRLDHLHQSARIFQALWWLGLFQPGQQAADLSQLRHLGRPHAKCDATRCTEQIGQHRHLVSSGVLEPQGRSARPQHTIGQGCHLKLRRHRVSDAAQFTHTLQLSGKVTQVAVFHMKKL